MARNRSRAAGTRRSGALFRLALALDRTVPLRTRQRCHRRAGAAERFLHGISRRRRVENHERGPHVVPGLRLTADCVHRGARGRAVESGHHLCRQRRIDASRFSRLRQWHVQISRRRGDLDAHRSGRHAPYRPRGRRSQKPEHCLRRGTRPLLRRASGARCLPVEGRRHDLAECPP